ncbi:MAG: hypothetical protein RIC29_15855 [Rhodospirillaceae bacterium]
MSIRYFVAFYNWDDPEVNNEHTPDTFQDEGPQESEVARARVEKEAFNLLSQCQEIWSVGLLELLISPNGYDEAEETGTVTSLEKHYDFNGDFKELKIRLSKEINAYLSRRSRTEEMRLTIRDTRFPKYETAQIEMT